MPHPACTGVIAGYPVQKIVKNKGIFMCAREVEEKRGKKE
jgi:hypothetical protein